jgi:hypothetical protein
VTKIALLYAEERARLTPIVCWQRRQHDDVVMKQEYREV